MSQPSLTLAERPATRRPLINLPQPIWLIILALFVGAVGGLSGQELIKVFGSGYGRALGDFALILIPSFILAACLADQTIGGAPRIASAIAPLTAAGMVCPDTSYAALAAISQERKLSVAFGSFAGYRLLFPAGPLIVATGLGIESSSLFLLGFGLFIPVWLTGEIWAHHRLPRNKERAALSTSGAFFSRELGQALFPLLTLGFLLVIGGAAPISSLPILDFITRPKGALLIAAALAIVGTRPERRRECLDSALSRSASLLLIIGAASAFGTMLTQVIPIANLIPQSASGVSVLILLFAVTMLFKMMYGGSTITFATVTPVLAPLVHAADISQASAVFAICLGSFLILPTDSFY